MTRLLFTTALSATWVLSVTGALTLPVAAAAHPAHQRAEEPADAYEAARAALNGDALDTYDDRLAALREAPGDAAVATAFARHAGQEGRRLGDDALTHAAREALAPWAEADDVPADLLTVRASLRQYDHEFTAAEADLTQVLAQRPDDAQALLSRAFVRAVTGEYEAARDDCVALDARTPVLVRETCLARAASLTGEAGTAQRRLATALARFGGTSEEVDVFALGVLGDVAVRNGDTDSAASAYERALALDPASVFVRASLADLMLDQGRADEARALLDGAPDTEALLLAKARLNGPGSDAAKTLEARMTDDLAHDDYRHAREHARFALDVLGDDALALRLAEANWANQREPIDAVLLIRAAEAADEPARAQPARAFVADTGLQDDRLTSLVEATGD